MKKHGISQMPVFANDQISGIISENIIINTLSEGKDVASMKVKDLMEEVPPTVPEDTPTDVVANLLKYYPIILVSSHGEVKGLISKSDILSKLF